MTTHHFNLDDNLACFMELQSKFVKNSLSIWSHQQLQLNLYSLHLDLGNY